MSNTLSAKKLNELINKEWDLRMAHDPIFATICGDHRFNDQLPKSKEAEIQDFRDRLENIQGGVRKIDDNQLEDREKENLEIFERTLENEIREIDFMVHLTPISKAFGFHLSFPELYEFVPLATAADYEDYLERLAGFKDYVDDQIGQMRNGIASGIVPARAAMEGVEKSISVQITAAAEENPLYHPFLHFPAEIRQVDQKRFLDLGRKAVNESVVVAFQRLHDFVTNIYLEHCREEIGASALPNGQSFYEHRIRMFTSLEMSAEAIHDIGKQEVNRIHGEMMDAIGQSGFRGDFHDFLQFLRTDPRFYVQSADQLLKEAAYILKKMDEELPRLFRTLPRMPYGIRAIPDYSAPGNTTAYYFPPAGDGTKAGIYYVNTYDLESRPLYEIEALSLHEAVPGHHLQIALQQEIEGIPNFRRFDYLTSTAFVEGWALYAERLGLDVGFYQDPYSNFGRLSYEMWRACRLVVDTGIHILGWDRDRAIRYMADNTSLTMLNITNEVDRYIAWPGQALAYKMGEIKIREMRELAQGELKDIFDVRAFHDELLRTGAVPLAILEKRIKEWIKVLLKEN